MNAKNVLTFAADQEARFVSVRFTDLIGAWHHLTFPIGMLGEDSFEDGFGFDASSLRGWAAIHESDMLLVPDPSRFWMDPFTDEATLCLIANAVDPMTKEGYWLDPRSVAMRAESYLKFTGIAETAYFLAQERGFLGGDPVSDWIEAERRVDRQLLNLATARLVERLESGVAMAAKNLSALKRRAAAMAAEARTELNADVAKLDTLRLSLRSKLEEIKNRSDEVSQKALHQAESVWNELSETLQRAAARTRH